ncbi:MAG TPA: sulfatase-like hydrolase/transferase, partial [Chitinophagaceae bacterium]|nr:sulfatase-like hydrolase/transferase [Chitinophagaceae bacterium]
FIGDHGVSGNAAEVYPDAWTTERLTDEHVPLLFYAPFLFKGQKRSEAVSQVDLLPTIASLAGQKYTNSTLGRNIITQHNEDHYAFIIHHDEGQIGLVSDSFYFTKNLNFKKEELHFLQPQTSLSTAQQDSLKAKMSELTTAYYETAKWMLLNNKK